MQSTLMHAYGVLCKPPTYTTIRRQSTRHRHRWIFDASSKALEYGVAESIRSPERPECRTLCPPVRSLTNQETVSTINTRLSSGSVPIHHPSISQVFSYLQTTNRTITMKLSILASLFLAGSAIAAGGGGDSGKTVRPLPFIVPMLRLSCPWQC